MSFALDHRELDARTVLVRLEGELGLAAAPAFKRTLLELRRAGYTRFILDFSAVTFFDSTALGVLVVFNRELTATGQLALAGLPPMVAKVLDVTGVARIFALFRSVEAAYRQLPMDTPPGDGAGAGNRRRLKPEDVKPSRAGPGVASSESEAVGALLTEDAAAALGIAATAIPFAGSLDAQAEQWLRALSRSGDTGMALNVLGAHDAAPSSTPDSLEACAVAGWSLDADVVVAVTRQASELASHHHRRAIQTDDLLGAVAKLYGRVFDRVLARHGVDRQELLNALRLDSSPPTGS